MKYRELLKEGESLLLERGVSEAALDARYLFEDSFGADRGFLLLKGMEEIPVEASEKVQLFRERIHLRGERIPLQQILGNQEFMGLSFSVNEHVLIPRQDTETLVEFAIEEGKRYKETPLRILDLCTGSGCIGISTTCYLKQAGRNVETVLSDISGEALKVAAKNAEALGLSQDITLRQSDLFEELTGEQFHMILSNPPYIPSDVIETLEPEVKDHEPRLALDGTADGVYYYKGILSKAAEHLLPGGRIVFEIGYDQSQAVEELLMQAGFSQVRTIKDLAGKDRVVTGVRNR